MKKYVKDWLKANDYTIADFVPCKKCGRRSVDLHHIIPRSHGGSDEPSNLMPLCREHHDEIHFKPTHNETD